MTTGKSIIKKGNKILWNRINKVYPNKLLRKKIKLYRELKL
jgi:hypothetical protein